MRRVLNRVLLEPPLRADSGPSDWGFELAPPAIRARLRALPKGAEPC